MGHQSTTRFSNRVVDYERYRPGYPHALVRTLADDLGLSPASVVADIGSGTGISARMLLCLGCTVLGVEPNAEMRRAAEQALAGEPRFTSIAGTAEATTISDAGVDAVMAGQAFHWFDPVAARREWTRILKPGGWVALFWNSRLSESTPFLRAYEGVLQTFGIDYQAVKSEWVIAEQLEPFFGSDYEVRVFPHEQRLDREGLKGIARSSSYTPPPGHHRHEPMMRELERLFSEHQRDSVVRMEYETRLYTGHLAAHAPAPETFAPSNP